MSTQSEIIHAQQGAYDFSGTEGRNLWWGRHLIGPVALTRLYADSATLDRIRAHFQHGADESLWPPGTPLDQAVWRLVAERNALLARLEEIDDEAKFKKHMRERRHEQINPPMTSDKS